MTVIMQWPMSPGERSLQCSPVALRLIDDLTGQGPIGKTDCVLFIEDAPGQWRKTGLRPLRNAGGFLIFPGLGRSREVAGQPPRRYRAEISAEFYRPFYPGPMDGVEFDAPPFNDDNPPAQPPSLRDVLLVPATNYPFAPHLRVLRGQVRNAAGPTVNAEVSRGNTERVLTDEKGSYALPLRLTPNNTAVAIDAIDHTTGENGQISITLPADLGGNKVIVIA
jgi:hypothetical protein